jgi:ChpA-C
MKATFLLTCGVRRSLIAAYLILLAGGVGLSLPQNSAAQTGPVSFTMMVAALGGTVTCGDGTITPIGPVDAAQVATTGDKTNTVSSASGSACGMQIFSIGSSTTEAKADDSTNLDDGDTREIVRQLQLLNGVVAYDGSVSEELCVTPPSGTTKCGSSTTFANISVAGRKLAQAKYTPGTEIPIDHFELPQPLLGCAQGSDFNGKLILGEFLNTTDSATGLRNLQWNALHLIGDAECSSPSSKVHVDLIDASGAEGAAVNSPGVVSGNVIQVPVEVPVNVCGNTVNVVALLNPTFGNVCVNK